MMADLEDYDEEEDEDMMLDDSFLDALAEDSENWPCWSRRCKRNRCNHNCMSIHSQKERNKCHAGC